MSSQRPLPARRAAAAALCLAAVVLVSGCGAFSTPVPETTPPVLAAATPTAVHAPDVRDDELGPSITTTVPPMFTVNATPTTIPPTVTVAAIPTTTVPPATLAAPQPTTAKPTPKPAPKPSTAKPAPAATTPAAAKAPVQASGPAVTGCGNPNPSKVMLTFDDGGPTAPAILAILDRYGIKARWFPTGEWANANGAFIARLKGDGQMLGNHTYSHPQMYAALGTAELKRQIDLGYHPTNVFRFPYGASDEVSRAMVRSAGYSICGWSIDTNDWRGNSTETITSIVTGQARPGAVVLMHMKFQPDVEALPTIIDNLRGRGLI